MDVMSIINAISSIGTFAMALFYFVSVSIQLYQMRLGFSPALGIGQTFLVEDKGIFKLQSATNLLDEEKGGLSYFSLYNLGGGTARHITIDIYLNKTMLLQEKYVHILPGNENYLLPINEKVHKVLEQPQMKDNKEMEFMITLKYKSSVKQRWHHAALIAQFDAFTDTKKEASVYEIQFINEEDYANKDN
ncbi:hypothetical protein [Tetragenococcus solitarius]|uniref:DUF2393 domain-containing protein n=1 Tax=Tetragenococcus solitarius TaxID=71453 RepID=A0ABN3Y3E4_9ENTE|nr:hypothetical protein [Tetragenococcus solitarius]